MDEGEELDFFERDRNGNAIVQPEIPMFEDDFHGMRKAWPLSWWGILPPTEEEFPTRTAGPVAYDDNRWRGISNSSPYNRRDDDRKWRQHHEVDARVNRPHYQQQRDGGYSNRDRRWQGGSRQGQRQRMEGIRHDGRRGEERR